MRLYLKIFLAMGIPYGMFMGIFSMFFLGFEGGLFLGLVIGLLFGGSMSLLLGTVHKVRVRKYKDVGLEAPEAVHQVRRVTLGMPIDRVYDCCIEAVAQIRKGRIVHENREEGKIDAKAGMTWATFGDKIKIGLVELDEYSTEIEVSSRPIVSWTLIDYGKNLENVLKIESFLKQCEAVT